MFWPRKNVGFLDGAVSSQTGDYRNIKVFSNAFTSYQHEDHQHQFDNWSFLSLQGGVYKISSLYPWALDD